jgi:hypothetical protein
VSFREITLWIIGLLLLIGLFGRLEHLIYETLDSVMVSGLVFSLGVENADPIQEAFKFAQPRPVLLVVTRLLYVVDGAILLPLLVMTLGGAGLIRGTRLLILLLLFGVEGRLLSQGIFVGYCQHLFKHPGILHGELADQGRVHDSFLKEHDD